MSKPNAFDDILYDEAYHEEHDKIVKEANDNITDNVLDYLTSLKMLDAPKNYLLYYFDASQLIRREWSDKYLQKKFPISCVTEDNVLVIMTDYTPYEILNELIK